MTAKPFLKWFGGKSRSVDAICALLPRKIDVYSEGFFGGGAVFWQLAEEGRFREAIITDVNQELVVTTCAVRDNVESVITEIGKLLSKPVTEERYYSIRAKKPKDPANVAARMIALNKLGYNGLYRVNKSGGFNSPYGKRETFDADVDNLRRCSELLKGVSVICYHYDAAIRWAKPDDAVYLDPPYASPKEDDEDFGFREYSKEGFGPFEQDKLASACKHLSMQGVPWVASNADTRSVRERYLFAKMRTLEINRTVGCKASTRGKIGELLIWDVPDDDRQLQMFGGAA